MRGGRDLRAVGEPDAGLGRLAAQDVGIAEKSGREFAPWPVVDIFRRPFLNDASVTQDADAVGHGQRFFLIMGDEDGGDANLALDALQFHLHVDAQRLVERGERLQQQHARLRHDGAGERHALALAAGKLVRAAAAQLSELHQIERACHRGLNVGSGFAPHRKAEGDIIGNAHIGKQRIVLEHHADAALFDRNALDTFAADDDAAGIGEVEAGDQPQQRGLSRSGRSKKGVETAVGKVDRDIVQRLHSPKTARYVPHLDLCHYFSPPNLKKRAVSSMSAMETVMMMVEIALISGVKPLRIAA